MSEKLDIRISPWVSAHHTTHENDRHTNEQAARIAEMEAELAGAGLNALKWSRLVDEAKRVATDAIDRAEQAGPALAERDRMLLLMIREYRRVAEIDLIISDEMVMSDLRARAKEGK